MDEITMSYITLDDDKIVELYKNGTTIIDIQKRYNISSGTVYRHLKAKGITSNRKKSIPWTDEETNQLIKARADGLTGAEMYERIPTRKPAAIKSCVQKLRIKKLVR